MRASAWLLGVLVSVTACTPTRSSEPSPSAAATALADSEIALPPSAAPSAAASAPPTAAVASGAAPVSAGAVAGAGVLFVQGADDSIYRYDSATGVLQRVWRASTFDVEIADGVYAIGRHGGVELLRWDGTTAPVPCGTGYAADPAANGACASAGVDGVFMKLPTDAQPRQVLPADWGASSVALGPTGDRLLLVRTIRQRPGPGMDPGLAALWVMERDGTLRQLYRPAEQGVLSTPVWSSDGRMALLREITTTSNSMAADGFGIRTLLVDVASGSVKSLGSVMGGYAWSADGRLAFVRGEGRLSWDDRHLIVRDQAGTEHEIAPSGRVPRVAILPAWGPAGDRLAWISGPKTSDFGGDSYIEGKGAGRRVAVIQDGGLQREVACGDGRVTEGVRWSADGSRLLLLCRVPGHDPRPLELWLHRVADGTSAPLVRGLLSNSWAGGFGYYGQQPPITSVAAWSLAVR